MKITVLSQDNFNTTLRLGNVNDSNVEEDKDFFFIEGSHQPIRGNGLILGCDDEGESVDTTASVDEVAKKTKFLSLSDVNAILANGNNF